jgi:hypothetical protein
MFYAVIIAIIVGTFLFVKWAKRKIERQAERDARGGGPQGPNGGA